MKRFLGYLFLGSMAAIFIYFFYILGVTLWYTLPDALNPDKYKNLDTDTVPVVYFRLGDSFEQMLAQSTFEFGEVSEEILKNRLAYWHELAKINYTHPAHEIIFPVSSYFSVTFQDHRVRRATIRPQLKPLPLEEMLILIDEILHSIDKAGWQRTDGIYRTFDEIRAWYADPSTSDSYMMSIQRWNHNNINITVYLRRQNKFIEQKTHKHDTSRDTFSLVIEIDPRNT